MNPSYQSWRRSDHAKTPCLDCHSDGSKTNRFIKFIELGTKHIPQEVLEKYEPIKVAQNEIISEKTCVRCHKPKKRSESKGRIMDHKTHADIDLNCKTCHNRVSHEDAPRYTPLSKEGRPEPYFADYMTMRKGCWRCHKKGGIFIAANGKEIPGPYTIGKAVALTDCGICHARYEREQFSKDVEEVWRRHVQQPPWKQGVIHGQRARKSNFAVCKTCHDPKKRCTVCHQGITMPHKDNWVAATEHGRTAKATNKKPCRMCHDLKEVPSCSANGHHHEEFVTASKYDLEEFPWKSGRKRHGPVARATNAQPCLRCHEQESWCTTQCHRGITMPHGPEWRQVHYKFVGYTPGDMWNPKPTPCDLCHNADGKSPRFCIRCHHKSIVPPNVPKGISPMKLADEVYGVNPDLTEGISVCGNCHELQFCYRCHSAVMDIPPLN